MSLRASTFHMSSELSGGGLLRTVSLLMAACLARSAALRARSCCMWRARSAARVRRRFGIITPVAGMGSVVGAGSVAVVMSQAGKKIRLPGSVLWVLPLGEVHTTVPSGNWRSAQPVQNVLSKW